MKKTFLCLIILIILTWQGYRNWPVTVHIQNAESQKIFSIRMPLKDKKRLDYFFREVCFLNVWAYTLMGSKPKSIDQYKKPWAAFWDQIKQPDFFEVLQLCFWPPHFKRIHYLFTPREYKMNLGWKTLNKYFKHFPNSKFALNTYERKNNDTVAFSLINKVQFIKTIKQHIEDFQDTLQKQAIEPEDLIDNEKLRTFMRCHTHDGFAGTLLGFGRDNAWLYYKYRNMDDEKWPLISAWPEEELVNLEQLNQRTLSFQSWELSDLFYPRFACDPNSEETKQLKQTYRAEREKIIQYFEGKDLVEAVLSLFNQECPSYNIDLDTEQVQKTNF